MGEHDRVRWLIAPAVLLCAVALGGGGLALLGGLGIVTALVHGGRTRRRLRLEDIERTERRRPPSAADPTNHRVFIAFGIVLAALGALASIRY